VTLSLEILFAVASLIFSAGGLVYVLRSVRKDCNGLGAKTGRMTEQANARYLKLCLALMAGEDSLEKRAKLAEMLRE